MVFETERELIALIIGYRVREARLRKRISQSELGQGLGSQSMISLIESGKQLPPPDVLSILAERLQEPVLAEYVPLLESGHITVEHVSASNQSILLDMLRTRRGRWDETHGQVALHLCQHYYTDGMFEIVRELAGMIRENLSTYPTFYAEASLLLGGSLLSELNYPAAERTLVEAEKLSDHLRDEQRGRLFYNLAYLYTECDSQGLALWYAKNAAELFHRNHDFVRFAKALGLLGTVQSRMGRLSDARETLELCYEIAEKWGISDIDRGRVEATLAEIHAQLQNFEFAKMWVERAAATISVSNDTRAKCSLYWVQTLLCLHDGTDQEVMEAIQKSVRAAELTQDHYQMAQSKLLAAHYLPSEAARLQSAQSAYEITANNNLHIEHALAAECLAQMYERQGYKGEAMHYQKMALQSYRDYIERNSMFKEIIQRLPKYY